VINLPVGMRVRNLDNSGQQDERNADDPEPTDPG
jgi:hypothetical protein